MIRELRGDFACVSLGVFDHRQSTHDESYETFKGRSAVDLLAGNAGCDGFLTDS
jgi:hypothetical protein